MYDLKQYLHKANQKVPAELEQHESAQVKPGVWMFSGGLDACARADDGRRAGQFNDKAKRAETVYAK
jgi:hypothetical protein